MMIEDVIYLMPSLISQHQTTSRKIQWRQRTWRHLKLSATHRLYQQLLKAYSQENINASYHCPFLRGIWYSLDSPHKGPVFAEGVPHFNAVIMGTVASQDIGVSIVYPTVCSGAHQRKHQSSASLAFVRGIHQWPTNSPHKGIVTREMFPFDDVIMPCHEVTIFYV